jgi:ribonuclease J
MADKMQDGLYWTSLGGNNDNDIGGNGHVYTNVKDGKESNVLVDLGLHLGEQGFPMADQYMDWGDKQPEGTSPAKALIVTHAHLDHIGGLAHQTMRGKEEGFKLPEIHATPLTIEVIKREFEAKKVPEADLPVMKPIKDNEVMDFGEGFKMETFPVSHSVSGGIGLKVEGSGVKALHTGDFKTAERAKAHKVDGKELDASVAMNPMNWKDLDRFKEEGIDLILSDSTSAPSKGHNWAAENVENGLKDVLSQNKNRQVVASILGSADQTIASYAKAVSDLNKENKSKSDDKVIVLYGYSLVKNYEANKKTSGGIDKHADRVQILDAKSPEARKIPDNKKIVLSTGAFGMGALANTFEKMGQKKGKNKGIPLNGKQITFLISQRPIPNVIDEVNEKLVAPIRKMAKEGKDVRMVMPAGSAEKLGIDTSKDKFFREHDSIYEGGHGKSASLKEVYEAVKPKNFIAMHGSDDLREANEKVAADAGLNVIPAVKNGERQQITPEGVKPAGKVETGIIKAIEHGPFWDATYTYEAVPNALNAPEQRAKLARAKLAQMKSDKEQAQTPDAPAAKKPGLASMVAAAQAGQGRGAAR